ncbi:hypothetical protein A9Q99_12920 [Gammaproteobacteria bacterium 45_16_T64]|nr:hypothetical protein A9Q99_12920 [Gammaproteobacteria bacterium 45_16_T64]
MNRKKATYQHWVSESLPLSLTQQIERLRNLNDVKHVRIMPDAHLAHDVCIGSVLASDSLIYPRAIGGDIGCGMLAAEFTCAADAIGTREAKAILTLLRHRVPIIKQPKENICSEAFQQIECSLSHRALSALADKAGRIQLGTLGRGNHFLELQKDACSGALWVMIHTGSRAMGPAIRDHYETLSSNTSGGLHYLQATSPIGQHYLQDHNWARSYAAMNRRVILQQIENIIFQVLGVKPVNALGIDCDHNHLQQETHDNEVLWVHRKGASAVHKNCLAIIPGSMGTPSFHVIGKGNQQSLCSSSHGAGRCMSRHEAKKRVSFHRLQNEMEGIFYEKKQSRQLVEESPSAYKDISKVMKAQKKLVTIKRKLLPILSYKG